MFFSLQTIRELPLGPEAQVYEASFVIMLILQLEAVRKFAKKDSTKQGLQIKIGY
jgi:hypothetical protein